MNCGSKNQYGYKTSCLKGKGLRDISQLNLLIWNLKMSKSKSAYRYCKFNTKLNIQFTTYINDNILLLRLKKKKKKKTQ